MNVDEHSSLGASPDIPDEDQEDVKFVMKMFHRYKKHREKYDRNWLHYYKMFRGDQWDGIRMPKHRQKECVNMIWQTIQSNVPLQTDVRPNIQFIPEEPTDKPFAETLNKTAEADWERNNWLEDLTEIIYDSYLYGIGYSENGYDQTADYGLGSATFKSIDPFYVYPDPESRDVNCDDSEGFIIAKPEPTDRVKREYPELAHLIKSDIKDVIQSTKTALNDFQLRPSNSDRDMPDVTFLMGRDEAVDKTLVITAYLKPKETEEVEDEAEEGDVKIIVKKKYPFGRVIKIASGVVLEKTDHLPFQHGKFPFSRLQNYILPREFYGVSEVEQLESPQRVFNKLLNASLEIMSLMGNPVWIVDTSSGVNPDQLINRTGLVVEKEPGSEVRREIGVQLSGTALSLIDRMETWFNNVAGSQDVSRGQTPGSVTAASAIEQLQEAARTRIRQKQRNLDMFLRDFGRQYSEIVLEKYSQPRVFRVTNDEGSNQYFKMRIEDAYGQNGEQLKKAVVQQYSEAPDGTIVPDNELKNFFISSRFDVKVNTGSTLPFSIADKEQKSLNLFDRGIIDAEEVLKTIDYPNREAVLQRLKEREEQLAAQQAQGG